MNRRNCFDTARHIAALMVLFSHHFALSGLPEPYIFNFESIAGIAVIVFFSISGFLIAKSAMNSSDFIDFMSKRIKRIFPALVPCSIFMFIILGCILSQDAHSVFSFSTLHNIIKTISLSAPGSDGFSDKFIHSGINGSLWTLPLEFFCYLITGYIVATWKKPEFFTLVFIVMIFSSVIFMMNGVKITIFSVPLWLFFLRASSFFFGSVLALNYDKWKNTKVSLFIAFALSIYTLASYGNGIEYAISGYLLISFMTILICTSIDDFVVKGRFDYSYGIYIYAFPVQQLVINYFNVGFYTGMLISIILTLALAMLSWHFIEKKSLSHKSKKLLLKKL